MPSLAEASLPEGGLTDADYAEHVREVEVALDKALAEGMSTDDLYTINPDRDIWTGDRAAIHDQIIEDVYARAVHVPNDRLSIIAGGLGGAGKTTVLEQHAGIDRSKYLTINPDHFKEDLARRGLIPRVEGLSLMEASTLAHEESSYLARQLARRALTDGKNVIWDITMSSKNSSERRVDELRSCGYDIDGIFIDIPVEVSAARIEARHRQGHELYLAGVGPGGRYLPGDEVRAQFDAEHGSINRGVFEELKHRLDHWTIFDNSTDGSPPTLIGEGRPERFGLQT